MEVKQQLEDVGQQLQQAVLQAAMPAEGEPFNVDEWRKEALARKGIEMPKDAGQESSSAKGNNRKSSEKPRAVSPRSGAPVPVPTGRKEGVKNRLTNLRDAVLEAFDQVGGAQYLARLAEGTSSDRAAFVSLVSKVLPTQINAQVEGGVQIQLSWLAARQIGTTVAQEPEQITQVVDLQKDSAGKYRIIDPATPPEGGQAAAGATDEKAAGGADAP